MILPLLLFLPLIAHTFPGEEGSHLPKEVKEKLEKQFRTDLKTRVENLKKIGYEYPVLKDYQRMDAPSQGRKEEDLSIWETNTRAGIARYLWDGDIDLTQEQFEKIEKFMKQDHSSSGREKRQAYANLFKKWRNRKVYYYFDDNFGQKGRLLVKEVIEFYEKHTCIRFEENPTVINRIQVYQGAGCSSNPGAIGGEQIISLGQQCWIFGTVAHEFLHAMGFLHTHVRPDRDDFVSVKEENIDPDFWIGNFPKSGRKGINMYTPYEYASVMQYPANAFSLGNKIGIIAKDYRFTFTMGSRRKLTFYDLKALNEHYMCTAMCPPIFSAKCRNGGYPNPNKCSVCICPDGYGGRFCNERPVGCGSSLVATSEWKETTSYVNKNSTIYANGNLPQCHDWITAPDGKFVEVKISSLDGASCHYSCNSAALEIKLESPETTSPRLCCNSLVGSTYVSKLNPTPVIAFTAGATVKFRYQYRFVDEAPHSKEIDPLAPSCTDELATCPSEQHICSTESKTTCPVTCNICPK